MSDHKNNEKAAKPSKKAARQIISSQLEKALPELREALGEKKFHHRLKKAVKILSEDFTAVPANTPKPQPKKEAKPAAKQVKKDVPKKAKKAKKAAPKKAAKEAKEVVPA